MRNFISIKSMFTANSEFGAEKEGRKNARGFCFQPLSFLTQYAKLSDLHRYTGVDEYLNTLDGYSYTIEFTTFIDLEPILEQGRFIPPVRLGTLASRDTSYNERRRTNKRMEIIAETDLWKWINDYYITFIPEICDGFLGHYHIIKDDGDKSVEQALRYYRDHAGSSFILEKGCHYEDLFTADKLSGIGVLNGKGKKAWQLLLAGNDKWFNYIEPKLSHRHKFDMIRLDQDDKVVGIRNKPGKYEIITHKDNYWKMIVELIRSRIVLGLDYVSVEDITIYDTEIKEKAYKPIYDICRHILPNVKMHFIEEEGLLFYLGMPKGLFCYDINNAEKQVGNCITCVPYSCDAGDYKSVKFARCLISGCTKTRPMNAIYLSIMLLVLKEKYGITIKEVWMGGDNFAITVEIPVDIYEVVKKLIERDERILGYSPVKQCVLGTNFTIDGPDSMKHLSDNSPWFEQLQERVGEMRALQATIQYNYAYDDDCHKFYEFCYQNKLRPKELYGFHQLSKFILLHPEIHEKIKDKFARTLEWLSVQIPLDPNPNYGVDSSVKINYNPDKQYEQAEITEMSFV